MSEIVSRKISRSPAPTLAASVLSVPTAKAFVGIIHGYADYGARYQAVMRAFAERGIGSATIDLRGHGDSEGERGNCERFSDFLDDARALEDLVAEVRGGGDVPTFLLGHSFGGLVATSKVLDSASGLRGLLLSGPFFGLAVEVPKAKQVLGRVASKLVPSLGLPAGIKGSDLTHDEAIARAYDSDPRVFKLAKARWFREAEKAQARVALQAPTLTLPCRIVFGGADRVASLSAARAVFERIGSKDKTFVEEPGLFHEVLNEPCYPRLVAEMADWILERSR